MSDEGCQFKISGVYTYSRARGLSNVGGMDIMKKAWEKIVL